MTPQTITEYLNEKNIPYIERGNELVAKCFFSSCDQDSRKRKAHLYFNRETGQYDCKKCGAQGNLITLAKHLGDGIQDIALNSPPAVKNETRLVDATNIWELASAPTKSFPYLVKKKILPHNSRFWNGRLVLPLYTPDGILSSLQFIDENGNKKFLAGGKVAGCYALIGLPEKVLCIAEGFATAASIFEATGHATAIAFSSGNLKATAIEIKRKYPDADIILCGDVDATGFQKSKEAAEAIGARLAFPVFEPADKVGNETPSDFNDLSVIRGNPAVQSSIASSVVITPKFGFTQLDILLNEAEETVSWVVEDLLPSGGFSIIAAKPKVGKSTLARQIALSVSRGEPFLGRQTTKGAVLYVSLEEKRSEVRNHFRLMGATGKEDLGVYVGSAPEDANEWLKTEIERKKPVLVIVDTLFRFARVSDVNDYSKVITALDPLLTLARTQSAHLMVIHHARKSGGDGADATLGSTAIFGSVDTAIVLKRSDSKRTIETQQRYGIDMEAAVLVFDLETKMVVLGGTKEEDDILKISESILEFLKTADEPMTEAAINDEIEGRTTLKRKALRGLLADGKIIRNGTGKRGDPYFYSCSLVPNVYEGTREQDTNNAESAHSTGIISGSEDFNLKI